MEYQFEAELWEYGGAGSWVFATLPVAQSDEIRTLFGGLSSGFGALGVQATTGETTWTTSLFFDTKAGAYLLPLKKAVRSRAGLQIGARAAFTITVLG